MTPFFFFSVGGILVIEGNLTFGALVAALAAYKDLSAPWKRCSITTSAWPTRASSTKT